MEIKAIYGHVSNNSEDLALFNKKVSAGFPSPAQISLYELDGEFRLKYLGQIKLMPANPIYKFMSFEVSLSR